MIRLTDERRLALFPTETIVRDSHHCHDMLRAGFEPVFESRVRFCWMKFTVWKVFIFKVFLVRIFDIRTEYGETRSNAVFSPYAGKRRSQKLRIWTLFTQWLYIRDKHYIMAPFPASVSVLFDRVHFPTLYYFFFQCFFQFFIRKSLVLKWVLNGCQLCSFFPTSV